MRCAESFVILLAVHVLVGRVVAQVLTCALHHAEGPHKLCRSPVTPTGTSEARIGAEVWCVRISSVVDDRRAVADTIRSALIARTLVS